MIAGGEVGSLLENMKVEIGFQILSVYNYHQSLWSSWEIQIESNILNKSYFECYHLDTFQLIEYERRKVNLKLNWNFNKDTPMAMTLNYPVYLSN